jgi:acyl-CoA-binding protein
MVFGMDETNRLHLYGLYQQATKGDFDENAHKGLLSMFSGPNNFEKIAWKKHKGMPREVAMHNWVFETKKITDLFSTEKLCNICRDDKRLREKPSIKSLKIF